MKYESIRDDLHIGDLVLFSGKGNISDGIKFFTASKWSHIGVVVKIEEWDSILLWESTTLSNIADAIDGKSKQGVQTVALSDRIDTYDGDVAIRMLVVNRTPQMIQSMKDFRKEVKNRPYEQNRMELVKAAYDNIFGANEEDLSSLFCSELVAELYQRMGLLSDDLPSNEYTPADFSEKKNLQLLRGVLGDEILLTK